MKEIWKDVDKYPNYQVSNFGRARTKTRIVECFRTKFKTLNGQLLHPSTDKKGYKRISLRDGKRQKTADLHRLVALAHIPNPENKPFINHIDGNPGNNHISNLEWCTREENQQHAKYILKRKFGTQCQKIRCLETGKEYESIKNAWRDTGVHWTCIAKVLKGKEGRTQAGGYHWVKV